MGKIASHFIELAFDRIMLSTYESICTKTLYANFTYDYGFFKDK